MILSDRDYQVLRALCARIFPRDPRFPVSGGDVDLVQGVEKVLAPVSPVITNNLKRAIFAFERGAHLSQLTHRPFTGLAPEEQDAYIRAWSDSHFYPRRILFNALKTLVTLVYVSNPEVERAAGYSPTGER